MKKNNFKKIFLLMLIFVIVFVFTSCNSNIDNLKMKELENLIGYKFNNIEYLNEAMCTAKIKKGKNDMVNEKLALVGDTILDFIICETGYKTKLPKGIIDNIRQILAGNEMQYTVFPIEEITKYAHTDEESKIVTSIDRAQYVEAIMGAVYYDCGEDIVETKKFIKKWYLMKAIEEAKKNSINIRIEDINAFVQFL